MWHEARRSERKVHDLMDAARRRAQRRAAYLARRRGDPQQALQVSGTRCRVYRDDALYQATEDQQGLIPWNGKQDVLIDSLFLQFLMRRVCSMLCKSWRQKQFFLLALRSMPALNLISPISTFALATYIYAQNNAVKCFKLLFTLVAGRPQSSQPPASKGAYSQVGYSYKGDGNEESEDLNSDDDDEEEEDDGDDKDFSSDDSSDERMESIAKEFGVKRYNWLVYMDKKAKEEETDRKKLLKAILPSDQRRSPSYEAYSRGRRSSGGQILEALHSDPASSLSVEQERSAKLLKPLPSTSAALAKLNKGATGVTGKTPQTEKKETPQERLKRIMSKQLNKQIRKDTAAEIAKKREQERQRQEKLAEVGRYRRRSRSRSLSRSPPSEHLLRVLNIISSGAEDGDIAEAVVGAEAQEGTVLARAPVPGHPLVHQGNFASSSTEAGQDTESPQLC
ncbi:hypothetical protein HU200_034929 [Digitaria exilis]|uniref:Suppressor of white apricot N-terminal domain-containing protein n=1 Tax=Digitaria exilis TaxID=1010633 RepID=A0A835BUE2_9POAL|nr:hypothetical protein HU200_034929 [Digitaria exilis]